MCFWFEGLEVLVLLICQGNFMFTLNLKSTYWHVAMHPDSLELMGVKWHSMFYIFTMLPFGLNLSPWVFTKVGCQMVKVWRTCGLRLVLYMDDLWVAATGRLLSERLAASISRDLATWGWTLNNNKSALEPQQQVTFLSLGVNSSTLEFVLLAAKQLAIKEAVHVLLALSSASVKALLSLAGWLVAYQCAVELA